MDTGGLAHMSYSTNFPPTSNGLGVPAAGFAARRANGPNVKRLFFEPTKANETIDNGAPTPRTSRSHLLAGLRTAPRSATLAQAQGNGSHMPSTAPPTQQQFSAAATAHTGMTGSNMYAANPDPFPTPRTAPSPPAAVYPGQMYPVDQILAPPEVPSDSKDQMDPNLYAQLVATNMYLAEQQQRLQQQLLSVQQAAAQMQGLHLNKMPQFNTPPVTPQNMNMFQQQVKQQMQPIITPVPSEPGVYCYYNPMTGQQCYVVDQSVQPGPTSAYGMSGMPGGHYSPPQQPGTPRFQVSPPPEENEFLHMNPPPKHTTSPPMEVTPLPPPSASAFRRGHRKAESMATDHADGARPSNKGAAGAAAANVNAPMGSATPTTTGFGPGQARAGEHPVRQPRGPPPLDELKEKPTTRFEGSKNFAARTRRSAVHNLVRAGLERRRVEDGRSATMSPVSEIAESPLGMSSEDDCSDSGCSGSGHLSGRPSVGSSRTSAHGAIGSDRPSRNNSFERTTPSTSIDSTSTGPSASDDAHRTAGSFAAVFKNGGKRVESGESKKKAPMLVLTSAEKRKTSLS